MCLIWSATSGASTASPPTSTTQVGFRRSMTRTLGALSESAPDNTSVAWSIDAANAAATLTSGGRDPFATTTVVTSRTAALTSGALSPLATCSVVGRPNTAKAAAAAVSTSPSPASRDTTAAGDKTAISSTSSAPSTSTPPTSTKSAGCHSAITRRVGALSSPARLNSTPPPDAAAAAVAMPTSPALATFAMNNTDAPAFTAPAGAACRSAPSMRLTTASGTSASTWAATDCPSAASSPTRTTRAGFASLNRADVYGVNSCDEANSTTASPLSDAANIAANAVSPAL